MTEETKEKTGPVYKKYFDFICILCLENSNQSTKEQIIEDYNQHRIAEIQLD